MRQFNSGSKLGSGGVILTGAGGEFITAVDWSSFGDVSDPGVWSQIHDEGVQALENITNIRVPMIAAIEGRAHIHSGYALLANVIVAAEGRPSKTLGIMGRALCRVTESSPLGVIVLEQDVRRPSCSTHSLCRRVPPMLRQTARHSAVQASWPRCT